MITFERLDVERSFLVYGYIFKGYGLRVFIKVIGSRSRSRSRSHEQFHISAV